MSEETRCSWIQDNGAQCWLTAHDGRDYCYTHWRITCYVTSCDLEKLAPPASPESGHE